MIRAGTVKAADRAEGHDGGRDSGIDYCRRLAGQNTEEAALGHKQEVTFRRPGPDRSIELNAALLGWTRRRVNQPLRLLLRGACVATAFKGNTSPIRCCWLERVVRPWDSTSNGPGRLEPCNSSGYAAVKTGEFSAGASPLEFDEGLMLYRTLGDDRSIAWTRRVAVYQSG